MNIIEKIAKQFGIKKTQVESTMELIDDGNTIPFIARYRKEATGGLSDILLRDIEEKLQYLRNLESRKEEVIRLIDEQGKLTEELRQKIIDAEVLQRVEDLYKPYKQKKATRASKAKEKGLEPLALIFFDQKIYDGNIEEIARDFVSEEKGVNDTMEAIEGAKDIIAEIVADDPEIIKKIRNITFFSGSIVSDAVDREEKTVYEMYYDYSERLSQIVNHRVLAINRGEKEKKLKVQVTVDKERLLELIAEEVVTNSKSIFYQLILDTVDDSYKRLIAPSVEREMRRTLTERAEEEAVKVFAKNTEKLLMVPPVKGKKILSIDPGYRTGCKVAVLDETGKLMAYTTVYPTQPKCDIVGTEKELFKLHQKFNVDIIVIGNGTGSRETEEVVSNFIKKNGLSIQYTIVNEAGASVYSASKIATEEYPDLDVTTRGAMSLGKRLQDPLAELVKIDPKHIGVGQYQHDINQSNLTTALSNVVEDCVNRVGVDLNTASPSLLSYIAGVNMGIAKNIVKYREEKGFIKSRKELLNVAKMGQKTFDQCAGFMRITAGEEPLDSTSVHPESYNVAEQMMNKIGISKDSIVSGGNKDIESKIIETYPADKIKDSIKKMADELGVGVLTLADIIDEMKKPARDPREDAPPVIFRNDVRSFEDLKVDMEMTGTVRNVVDFGAFVDIGVKNDGLVHISQLSNKFIKHPMDVVSVGDTVNVKILTIDHEKQKVGLTMKYEK